MLSWGLLLFPVIASAQIKLSGRVSDSKGQPMQNVSVRVENASIGTTTDATGYYHLNLDKKKGNLIFGFVGYAQKIMSFDEKATVIDVVMDETKNELSDVVVTAFGLSNSRRSVPYTVSSVKSTEITNAGTNNIGSALTGKLAGADFVATSGGPMAGTRVNLRGINSLDVNSRPLVVVNGIPIFDNDDSYSARGAGGNMKGSGLNDINPDDIESVTVLKGSNAAALYGSQAINGAIIIQTKTGREQKGIGVEYSANYTLNQNSFFPKFQEEYGAGTGADYFDKYSYNVLAAGDSMPFYSPKISSINFGPKFNNQKVLWWDGVVRPWQAQPNNYKDLFSNGSTLNNTVSMSGATDKSSFRLSFTNYDYKGFLPNMKESRNSVMLYASQKVSNVISADIFVNYIDNYRQNPPERIDRANYSMLNTDITSVYDANTINPSGYYLTDSASKYLNGSNISSNIMTPLIWDQKMNQYQDHRNTFLGTATITFKLSKAFSLRVRGGTDRLFDFVEQKRPFTAYAAATNLTLNQGSYIKTQTNNYKNHGDVLLNFNKQLNKDFSLTAFAGYSMDDEYDESSTISPANGLMYNNMYTTANYKAAVVTGTFTRPGANASASQGGERLDAVFASATFGYKKWFYVTATDRSDWSSYLPANSNHYNYPSVGASFMFSDLWKMPAFVSYGKLKVSYGITGVPGSRYFANASYSQGATYNSAILSSFTTTVPPSNIIAEKNHSFEIGLETGLFQDRVRVDLTYYKNRSNNMINSVPVALSTGAANLNINAGDLENQGIELKLVGDVIKTKDLLWQMTLNGTQISRKVLTMPAGLTSRTLSNNFTTAMLAKPGEAPYNIYMLPMATDAKGNVIVNASGTPTFSSAMVNSGNPMPKIYGGYINALTYKHFTFNVMLEYRFGAQVVSYDNIFWTATGLSNESLAGRDAAHGGIAYYVSGGVNTPVSSGNPPANAVIYNDGIIFKGVTAAGAANTTIIKASTYYQNRYYAFGTQDAVYNNDYLRLRELSLYYSFPAAIAKKLRVQSLSLGVIARNIGFLYKTVPNESPDAVMGTDNSYMGMMYSAYPPTRDFGASLKVSF